MKPSRVRVVEADRLEVEAVRVEAARLAVGVSVAAGTGAVAAVAVVVAADAHISLEVQELKQFRDSELRNSGIKTPIP